MLLTVWGPVAAAVDTLVSVTVLLSRGLVAMKESMYTKEKV